MLRSSELILHLKSQILRFNSQVHKTQARSSAAIKYLSLVFNRPSSETLSEVIPHRVDTSLPLLPLFSCHVTLSSLQKLLHHAQRKSLPLLHFSRYPAECFLYLLDRCSFFFSFFFSLCFFTLWKVNTINSSTWPEPGCCVIFRHRG